MIIEIKEEIFRFLKGKLEADGSDFIKYLHSFNDKRFYIDAEEEIVLEIRDWAIEKAQFEGMDEQYKPTAEGKKLLFVIDQLFV